MPEKEKIMTNKTFRIRFSINGSEPKIFKVTADTYEAAQKKLEDTFRFEEMLSEDEVGKLESELDKIINNLNGKTADNSRA